MGHMIRALLRSVMENRENLFLLIVLTGVAMVFTLLLSRLRVKRSPAWVPGTVFVLLGLVFFILGFTNLESNFGLNQIVYASVFIPAGMMGLLEYVLIKIKYSSTRRDRL